MEAGLCLAAHQLQSGRMVEAALGGQMIQKVVLILALGFATAANAQTTHCEPSIVGMPSAGVDCKTSGSSAMPASRITWRDVPPRPCSRLERVANSDSLYCEARELAATRKSIGDMIATGKCDEALKAALSTGDLQFATEVRSFCSSAK